MRQFELLLYLMEKKKTTYAELAQHFEVSKKTIMRDIDRLSNMGIPVCTQPGYEGGVFLLPSYRFQSSFFTAAEIEDMVLAFHIVKQLNPKGEKNSVLKKLELLVPELTFMKEFDFEEYLKIDLFASTVSMQTPICSRINIGLEYEVFLNILVSEQRYTIAPLYYILRCDGVYLYCTDGKDFLTFPVQTISKCTVTSAEFDRTKYLPKKKD